MQIFVVDSNPAAIAKSLCDKHVKSQIEQLTEMLAIAHTHCGEGIPPGLIVEPREKYHYHALPTWCAKSAGNYKWSTELTVFLCMEYIHRYGETSPFHLDVARMVHVPFRLAKGGRPMTRMPTILPKVFLTGRSLTESHRKYYNAKAKTTRMTWTKRMSPVWFTAQEQLTIKGLRAYS